MATVRSIVCRDHGGIFQTTPGRGRPPVRCTDDNKCDQHPEFSTPRARKPKPYNVSADTGFRPSNKVSKVPEAHPIAPKDDTIIQSKQAAKDAMRRLKSLGWQVTAKIDYDTSVIAVTAVRDEELLIMTFNEGVCISQDYSLWNCDEPPNVMPESGMPEADLPFDTSEIPDQELVKCLAGVKCTWWNHLAQHEESAIIGNTGISIEHVYTGKGDEHPEDRIFKFIDHSGNGFRAFRLGALIGIK